MNELDEQDINAAQNQLIEVADRLEALQGNPQVEDYAADEYIDEAVESLKAAVADLERARRE